MAGDDVAIKVISANDYNYGHLTVALPGAKTFQSRATDNDKKLGLTAEQAEIQYSGRFDDVDYYRT